MTNNNGVIKVALTNLGKYNEGELIYTWLTLPATDEEITAAFEEIGVKDGTEYEEHFISDYEAPFSISEYASISTLNEKAEALSDLNEEEINAASELTEYGLFSDIFDAIQAINDGEVNFYYDCRDMEDVAREFYEQTGMLSEITKHINESYIDFKAIGRDMDIEGTFIQVGNDTYAEYIG